MKWSVTYAWPGWATLMHWTGLRPTYSTARIPRRKVLYFGRGRTRSALRVSLKGANSPGNATETLKADRFGSTRARPPRDRTSHATSSASLREAEHREMLIPSR